tara:strand:+ start:1975 stop:2223 length:249 start_codon:yes stop_codon:yes gene_type:complete
MSVARSDYQQVRAAQEKIDAERDHLKASMMDTVLYTNGAFSYHDLLQMEPSELDLLIEQFSSKVERENQAVQATAGKKSVKL